MKKAAILAAVIFLGTSCSDDNSDDNQESNNNSSGLVEGSSGDQGASQPSGSGTCEFMWGVFEAMYAYKKVLYNVTEQEDGVGEGTQSIDGFELIEKRPDYILIERHFGGEVKEQEFIKDEYLESCAEAIEDMSNRNDEDDSEEWVHERPEITDLGEQQLVVPAGSFKVKGKRSKRTGALAGTTTEFHSTEIKRELNSKDLPLLIKSVMETPYRTTTKELATFQDQ